LLRFLITQDIDALCYRQVLVKTSQAGEFAVKKMENLNKQIKTVKTFLSTLI